MKIDLILHIGHRNRMRQCWICILFFASDTPGLFKPFPLDSHFDWNDDGERENETKILFTNLFTFLLIINSGKSAFSLPYFLLSGCYVLLEMNSEFDFRFGFRTPENGPELTNRGVRRKQICGGRRITRQ